MRLLASATSTSRTGTPASSARPKDGSRSAASSSGRNLLKTGSSTTGATKLSRSTSSAAPAAAASGHQPGKELRRADEPRQAGAGQHRADRDGLDPVEREVAARLREKPKARSCVSPSQIETGSRSERREHDEQRAEHERAERLGQAVDDAGEPVPRRRSAR